MPERSYPDDDGYLELAEDSDESMDTDVQVQRAQEQLLALKRQQDQVEKQKRELEELGRRQDELQRGRAEMVEKFTRALVVVERETNDAQKRVEMLQAIDDSYRQHLMNIERINSKSWDSTQVNKELSKALSAVEDARTEYAKSRPRITTAAPTAENAPENAGYEYETVPEKDFLYWLKSGAAFTLPLMLVLILIFVILIAFFVPA